MDLSRYIGCSLLVYSSILATSGVILLVMHIMPLGLYLSLIIYYPLLLLARGMEYIHEHPERFIYNETILALAGVLLIFVLWLLLLWLGAKIYERVS